MKYKNYLLLLCIAVLSLPPAFGKPPLDLLLLETPVQPDSFRLGIAAKCSFNMNFRGTTGFSLSLAGGVRKEFKIGKDYYTVPSYQLSFNIYYNGIGNNTLDQFEKTQIDMVHSIALTNGFGHDRSERPAVVRPFNDMTANPVENDLRWSFSLGTNYILNNHARNQQLGFVGFNIWKVLAVGYYNDAAPFHKIGLGDRFDRLWTGGGFGTINVGRILDKCDWGDGYWTDFSLYYNYERFTADVQGAYVMSKYLSLNHVLVKDRKDNFYNRGQTSMGLRHQSGWGVNIDFLGHFRKLDIQDKTHIKRGFAKHYSGAAKRWLVDFYYQSLFFNRGINLEE